MFNYIIYAFSNVFFNFISYFFLYLRETAEALSVLCAAVLLRLSLCGFLFLRGFDYNIMRTHMFGSLMVEKRCCLSAVIISSVQTAFPLPPRVLSAAPPHANAGTRGQIAGEGIQTCFRWICITLASWSSGG